MTNTASPVEPLQWPADFPPSWSGCPQRPVLEVLLEGLATYGDQPVLVFDDGASYTGNQLRAAAEDLAGYFATFLKPGDTAGLAIGNRAEFVIAYLALVANRAVVVSLSPELGAHEAAYVVQDSTIVLAVTDETSHEVFCEVKKDSDILQRVITVRGAEPHGFAHLYEQGTSPLSLADVHADYDDLVDIGYTSGTTGLPKALGGTHAEWARYLDVFLRTQPRGTTDAAMLCPLQLHYGDPLTLLFAAMVRGSRLILMRRFSASRFWDVAVETQATEIITIGSIPDMLLARPESDADRNHHIRRARSLAIPKDRHSELERRFGFPWVETYGSSESGPAISMPDQHAPDYVGTGALGIPYPDVQARLVDTDGTIIEGPGSGELELSGLVVFEGYLHNEEATAEVLHEGWLRTGDVMRRDERGVFYFEGRRKELIRRSGVNVAPAEVEAVLRLHPDVEEAAVVPVADQMMGEEIKAYVQLHEGVTFDPASLAAFCATRLQRYKVPRYIEQRTEPFPRTPTQRIPKNQLKVDGVHRTDTAWDRQQQPAGAQA